MTDVSELRNTVARADEARRLLENPLLEQAFQAIEQEIVEQLKTVPERDAEGRDLLVRLLKLNGKYRAVFFGWVETGKLAREELRQRTLTQRAASVAKRVVGGF